MDDWLTDTRTSYDSVAPDYADQLRGALQDQPYTRAALALFAELVCASGGPVVDVGCGPGHITAHLRSAGLDITGIDLSPAMIEVAHREHPGVRFEVASMTDLPLADSSVAGLIAFWSLVHVPGHALAAVMAQFSRVLRPGGVLLVGFHLGDSARLKSEGYGGHSMHVQVYRRPAEQMAGALRDAGFVIEANLLLDPDTSCPGAVMFARRQA